MKRYQQLLLTFLFIFCNVTLPAQENNFANKLSDAALEITKDRVKYDPAYFSIPYPNGDVPADRGVCTDVVIRAYRKLGIDLQKEVHEDMKNNFNKYPKKWGLKKTDGKRYLIVHNIGRGQVIEDCLFSWKITGHYTFKQ